jgi:hypothetical protein
MLKPLLLHYLEIRQTPLGRLPEGPALHGELLAAAPRFYRHLPADLAADVSHRREALVRLLDDGTLSGLVPWLSERLRSLPALETLRVLEVLRERRINRHRARKLGLSVLLGHAELPQLAASRRQRVVRLLKHLVGEKTWSAVRRALQPGANGNSEQLLQRTFWGSIPAERQAIVREVLGFLAGIPAAPSEALLRKRLAARTALDAGEGLPRETLFGLRGTFHPAVPSSRVRYLAPATAALAHADGPLTEWYKKAWAEGGEAAAGAAPAVAAEEPLPGRLAVVLDLSASMASSGERAFHPAALGLALARRLQSRFADVTLHQVGGAALLAEDPLPRPQGGSDLAVALLEAARTRPETILVVTDGYESSRTGDAADVARGLRQLSPALQVLQVVPRFTPAEDLSSRRLADDMPLLPVDHEAGVGELLARVVLARAGELTSEDLEQLEQMLLGR